jgi:hypothetical protein
MWIITTENGNIGRSFNNDNRRRLSHSYPLLLIVTILTDETETYITMMTVDKENFNNWY